MFDFNKFIRGCYKLPGNPDADVYMLPVSGGVDSAALAIMMHKAFPHIDFHMMFTDTMADENEIYEVLDNLEAYLGKKINRIKPEKGLYELIEAYNGFLPSSRDRYCTKTLKLKPFEQHLAMIKPIMGGQIWSFVGIRADEPFRSGLISHDDAIHTELPYKAWGIERADVFKILDETIGIPRYYQRRTRSGCFSCWGMRRMETIGLLEANPIEFHRAGSYEKLSPIDLARARPVEELAAELKIGFNHVAYPIPRELDIRCQEGRNSFPEWHWSFDDPRPKSNVIPLRPFWNGAPMTDWKKALASNQPIQEQLSMLDQLDPMNRLWVAVEFRIDPGIGGDGVFWQQVVSFSTSRGGLSRQIQGHYEHRLQTAEAIGLSEEEVRLHVKYAVYCIEAPLTMMDISAPSDGTFTWKRGESFDMIKRLTKFAKRTLQAARIEQDAAIAEAYGRLEQAQDLLAMRKSVSEDIGRVLGMSTYTPKPVVHEEEEEDYIPCFACSI